MLSETGIVRLTGILILFLLVISAAANRISAWATEAVRVGIIILTTVAVIFAILVVALRFVWAWVVPDLFSGAVDQGLISADLSWLAVVKLTVLVGLLSGVGRALIGTFKRH